METPQELPQPEEILLNEKIDIDQVLTIAKRIGYVNAIAYISREWAEQLITECNVSKEAAIMAVRSIPPYTIRTPQRNEK